MPQVGCPDCQRTTAGDCGRHGSVTLGNVELKPRGEDDLHPLSDLLRAILDEVREINQRGRDRV